MIYYENIMDIYSTSKKKKKMIEVNFGLIIIFYEY